MFNYCIGNPAFNISESNNIAGTGGNTNLYKTAARNDFLRISDGGALVYITPKGIIPDLTDGFFKDFQVIDINLMDNISVWKYNTCFFIVNKIRRRSCPEISGGLCKKIFTTNLEERFPFVYYSGSNNGMNHHFSPQGKNTVIRKLPGKNNDKVIYDCTDKSIEAGPKFAFTVLESIKSYTVTEEPIFGGTICYVKTNTIEESEKLKLFVEKNPIYREYVSRMKLRGHAFGLRYVKKFDINQIVTGEEIPKEWKITEDDLLPVKYITNCITNSYERIKSNGEVFTPTELVKIVIDEFEKYFKFVDGETFLDSMCGNGQFLVEILERKILCGHKNPLSTIYGVDIMQDNVDECRQRLIDIAGDTPGNWDIVRNNIRCENGLTYDYSFTKEPTLTEALQKEATAPKREKKKVEEVKDTISNSDLFG